MNIKLLAFPSVSDSRRKSLLAAFTEVTTECHKAMSECNSPEQLKTIGTIAESIQEAFDIAKERGLL